MSSTPGVVNYPTSLVDVVSLIQAANNAATALTSSVTSSDTSLPVTSTTGFAATGVISVDDEIIA